MFKCPNLAKRLVRLSDSSSMRVQVLEWDSQFFGFPVGRLLELDSTDSTQAIQDSVRKSGCRVVYVGTAVEKPELSEHYILTQVKLHSSLREADQWSVLETQPEGETEVAAPSLVLQPYEGTADESLVQLALQAGWSSRFCVDTRFGRAAFELLYATWIHRSCAQELADVVLTASLGQDRVGLVTAAFNPPTAQIGLIAVQSEARGLGIGRHLIAEVAKLAAASGCERLSVITQAENLPALRLYERMGFQQSQQMHWYHIWNDREGMA